MRRVNILFSTTRQWNVGDEFIFYGVKRLLTQLGIDFNVVVYNRHPSIFQRRRLYSAPWKKLFTPNLDNSFHLDRADMVDYLLVAGSPAWSDASSSSGCLKYASENNLRIAFLGIGSHRNYKMSAFMDRLLRKHTDLVVTRDGTLYESLHGYNHVFQMPCPALFSAEEQLMRVHRIVNTVGLVVQDDKTYAHDLQGGAKEQVLTLYRKLVKSLKCVLIAHYIDDYMLARREFPDLDVYYSSDASDFPDIYRRCDLVISPRVHGCGLAASLGIPSYNISHDARGQTAKGFLSEVVHPSALNGFTVPPDVSAWSERLIQHRTNSMSGYVDLLSRSRMSESLIQLGESTGATANCFK